MIAAATNAGLGLGVLLALITMFQVQTVMGAAGIVSNINIVSDRVADVSSEEAWRQSYIKPGMTDQEKALAVWRSVVAHQHQNAPPIEYLQSPENAVLDPIKMFNVYGYGLCSVHASHVAALARAAGLAARNQSIQRHCTAEVFWNGEWHMLDASLVNYFPKPDGQIASTDEIIASIVAFYKEHPELKGNPEGLDAFRTSPGWKNGPALLANCPFYDKDGLLPANWPWQCGWQETMREYDGSRQFIYEPGYSMGYRVNVQLRVGERLTRNWFNRGLHVNMDLPDKQRPNCLDIKVGDGSMRDTPKYGDLAPGRIGNGVHEYDLPLASGAFRGGVLVAENLATRSEDGAEPAVHLKNTDKPGMLIVRMCSSYVYLGGLLELDAIVTQGGTIEVSFSENNGLDWKKIQSIVSSGKATIDLRTLIFRRYDYRLKFEIAGAGTGLDRVAIRNDIQHSQRPLPALTQGDNTITFSSGNEGTITIEGSTLAANRGKQVLYTDFHPQQDNISEPMISVKGRSGTITFPISTPGNIRRLRIFSFYRAMTEEDHWDIAVSFDGGKTFADVGTFEGPFKAMGKRLIVDQVPGATTSALIRFSGTQLNAAMLFNVRLDADYEEPHGGFQPVKVTYLWDENGVEKRDVHVATRPQETWVIRCAAKPLMKTLIVEPSSDSTK